MKNETTYILNIKNLMKEKKIPSTTIAEKLQVTTNTVSNWLTEKNPMNVPTLMQVCDILNVKYGSLFENVPIANEDFFNEQNKEGLVQLMKVNSELKDKIITLQENLMQERSNGYGLRVNEKAS